MKRSTSGTGSATSIRLAFFPCQARRLDLGSGSRTHSTDEYGLEGFCNIAITPWLMLTPDIQW